MAIYQTNIWVCEVCGNISYSTEEVFQYSDPVVVPPNDEEWDYVGDDFNEKLVCPKCLKNHGE